MTSPDLKICGQGTTGEKVQLYRCEELSSGAQLMSEKPRWGGEVRIPDAFQPASLDVCMSFGISKGACLKNKVEEETQKTPAINL